VYPPHLPLTATNVVDFFKVCQAQTGVKIQQLYAVAYILKLLSENSQAIQALADFELVSYAGSALPDGPWQTCYLRL
jgi:hypothetical protein